MPKLFIIGNGFDKSHGMHTDYSDFRQYLIENYDITEEMIDNTYCEIPQPIDMPDGGEEYDDSLAATAIIRLLDMIEGNKWKDIETSLGVLHYDEYLDNWDFDCVKSSDDDFDEKEYQHKIYNNEDNARYLCGALERINMYFQDWVRTIEKAENKNNKFEILINPNDDLFLNFNYTYTLEELYNAQNVCHIHGNQDSNIIFGHGSNEDRTDEFQQKWLGAEHALNQFQYTMKKDVITAYKKHIDFFHKIIEASKNDDFKIYSYGFSFSEADKFYIKTICNSIDTTKVKFYLNDFNKIELPEQKNALNECGFKGEILTFNTAD